jgi:hypothetical protein
MKIQKSILTGVLLGLVFWVQSCKKTEVDTKAPTLTFSSQSPNFSKQLVCGDDQDSVISASSSQIIQSVVTLKDDVELSQLKVEIHSDFDCHEHGGGTTYTAPTRTNRTTTDWEFDKTYTLSGKELKQDVSLSVPANATAGNYHYELNVLDKSGNLLSETYVYTIKITNAVDTREPSLILNNTPPTTASKGSTLTLDGILSDNRPLNLGGNAFVYLTYEFNGNSYNAGSPMEITDATASKAFRLQYTLPTTLATGKYEFTLHASDGVNNQAEVYNFSVNVN